MFGLGFSELIVLAIIIMIFVGPKQIPGVMKVVAQFVRQVTKAQRDFTRTVNQDDELRRVKESVDDVKTAIQTQADGIKKALTDDARKS